MAKPLIVHPTAERPRQPKRIRPINSTPNTSQASRESTVFCTRFCVNKLVTKTKPVMSARVSKPKPAAMSLNMIFSSASSGGSAAGKSAMRRERKRRSSETHRSAVTAAANSNAAAPMESSMCAVSSHPEVEASA